MSTIWEALDHHDSHVDRSYSHVWIVFHFHRNRVSRKQTGAQLTKQHGGNLNKKISHKQAAGIAKRRRPRFKAKISPPKLPSGKVGVFSARTPHRPNAIGLTLCRLENVDMKRRCLSLSGIDLVEGTPVVDIKPYVPHYDSIPEALVPEWVQNSLAAPMLDVIIESNAKASIAKEVDLLAAQTNSHGRARNRTGNGNKTKGPSGKREKPDFSYSSALRVYNSVDDVERAVTEMLRLDINSGGTLKKVKREGGPKQTRKRIFYTVLDGLKFECHWEQHGAGTIRVVGVTRVHNS